MAKPSGARRFAEATPAGLIITRLLCAPLTIWLARAWGPAIAPWLGVMLVYCCLSDIFDGIVARKLGVDSVFLRRADSIVDIVYAASLYHAVACLAPQAWLAMRPYFGGLVIVESAVYVVTFARFGRAQSAHNYASKVFGLVSAIVFAGFFFTGNTHNSEVWMQASLVVGMLARFDTLLIYCILREWTHDIPTAYHALLINRGVAFGKSKWFHSVVKASGS